MTRTRTLGGIIGLALALAFAEARGADVVRGFQKRVPVQAPTRIDWTFVLGPRSQTADPLKDYDSTTQQYDLYVPSYVKPKQPAALIVFISGDGNPCGWPNFQSVCREKSILFASPYGAGNDCPSAKRVRIVLDVLDDVRRRFKIDPDRTYLGGNSGGGRMACYVAFALPEYFGGTIHNCACNDLRRGDRSNNELWLQHRVVDRLSLALFTGETDFNRPEVERLYGPLFTSLGARCRVWLMPKVGHAFPSSKDLSAAVTWLEADLKRRRDLAKIYPASRADNDASFTREAWSKALLAEGKKRLEDPENVYRGLMQLRGVTRRWDDLPAADEAKKILVEYEGKEEKPWELTAASEQRRLTLAQARAFYAYASGPLPPTYEKHRVHYAKEALRRWQAVLKDQAGTKVADEAEQRIPAIEKIIAGKGDK